MNIMLRRIAIALLVFMMVFMTSACYPTKGLLENEILDEMLIEDKESTEDIDNVSQNKIVANKDASTIESRYGTPEGFVRVEAAEGSFGYFLRNQKLKPYGEKVLYYDGKTKTSKGVYDSVIDVEIGNRDLHQCADAIMLLRAEYLYHEENYDQISFHFVNGFKAEYEKWMKGYRIKILDSRATWYKQEEFSNTYKSFRKYMDMVFAYSGTLSLEKELVEVKIEEMQIGDVFIVGGSPGHAVIVVDLAENHQTGEKAFMLAQSYMPAQQTQILINPKNEAISPWYILNTSEKLITPEWAFDLTQLKGFE